MLWVPRLHYVQVCTAYLHLLIVLLAKAPSFRDAMGAISLIASFPLLTSSSRFSIFGHLGGLGLTLLLRICVKVNVSQHPQHEWLGVHSIGKLTSKVEAFVTDETCFFFFLSAIKPYLLAFCSIFSGINAPSFNCQSLGGQ